jgi:hypothetical protein
LRRCVRPSFLRLQPDKICAGSDKKGRDRGGGRVHSEPMKTNLFWGGGRLLAVLPLLGFLFAVPVWSNPAILGFEQPKTIYLPAGEPVYIRIHDSFVLPRGGWPVSPFTVSPFYHLDLLSSAFRHHLRETAPGLEVRVLDYSERVSEAATVVEVMLTEWLYNPVFGEFRVIFFATLKHQGSETSLGAYFGRGGLTPAGFYGDYRDFESAVDDAVSRFKKRFEQVVRVERTGP